MNPKNDPNTIVLSELSTISLPTFIAAVTAFLDAAEARFGPEPPALRAIDKLRAAKPRKGAEKISSDVASLAERFGLDSQQLSVAKLRQRMADAATLKPLETRLAKIYKRTSDECFQANVDVWEMTLHLYAVLKHCARSNGELAVAFEPTRLAFAYRHPKVNGAKPSRRAVRARAKLNEAVSLAERNGVPIEPASAPAAPEAEKDEA